MFTEPPSQRLDRFVAEEPRVAPESFVIKEVEMGFTKASMNEDGTMRFSGCQRVRKCSCNCNDCTWIG